MIQTKDKHAQVTRETVVDVRTDLCCLPEGESCSDILQLALI